MPFVFVARFEFWIIHSSLVQSSSFVFLEKLGKSDGKTVIEFAQESGESGPDEEQSVFDKLSQIGWRQRPAAQY